MRSSAWHGVRLWGGVALALGVLIAGRPAPVLRHALVLVSLAYFVLEVFFECVGLAVVAGGECFDTPPSSRSSRFFNVVQQIFETGSSCILKRIVVCQYHRSWSAWRWYSVSRDAVEQTVVCQYHRSWSTWRRCSSDGMRSRSWCASTTDYGIWS